MNELRELRHATGLGQREFAALRAIPLETFRPWDSGRRVVSVAVLQRAREAAAHHARRHELLTLSLLAQEFHVHVRTLQAAVRTGRLAAHFSRKRTPSPVLWQRVLRLEHGGRRRAELRSVGVPSSPVTRVRAGRIQPHLDPDLGLMGSRNVQ